MAQRPTLHRLAARAGIIPEYTDCTGNIQRTTDRTRELLLEALGFDAATEQAAERALEQLDQQQSGRLLDPIRVLSGESRDPVTLHLPAGACGEFEWRLELVLESGARHDWEGKTQVLAEQAGVQIPLSEHPEMGYHTLRATIRNSGAEHHAEQTLAVTPSTCFLPHGLARGQRYFGLCANLYTLRSRHNWGIGDFGDLHDLLAFCAEIKGAFVGLNPLHALRNEGFDISPYRPVSRLYRNMLYVDVSAVPELEGCPEVQSILGSTGFQTQLQGLQRAQRVAYEEIAALKRPLLATLHRTFADRHRGRDTPRGSAYARYVKEQGQALQHFATFEALQAHFQNQGLTGDWHRWPAGYHRPETAEVQTFRQQHAEEIDYHCYVQFELDCQLARASRQARDAGVSIGLYQDLAVGSSPDGSDTWAYPDLFVTRASIGAPPDPLGPEGQDWALPPLNPHRLGQMCLGYWRQLLRSALAHAGALRIDHVMGLARQFWIPAGHPPATGAYVRYPLEALLGILALESHRQSALIVGEDLGTVPVGFTDVLQRWNILSSQVLYFQKDGHGEFLPAEQYSDRALVTANTHDLAPLSGYWQGRDLALRREVAGPAGDDQYRDAQAQRRQDQQALVRRLSAEGLLATDDQPSTEQVCVAAHAFLCRTPAPLVGLALDDLVGETEPVNLPGIPPHQHPSWTRRMQVMLEDLHQHPTVGATVERCAARSGSSPAQ